VRLFLTSTVNNNRVSDSILKVFETHTKLHSIAVILNFAFIHKNVLGALLKVVHFSFTKVKISVHLQLLAFRLFQLFSLIEFIILWDIVKLTLLLRSLFVNNPGVTF